MRKFMVLAAVVAIMGLLSAGRTAQASPGDPYADSVVAVSGTFGAPALPLSSDSAVAVPLVLGAPDAPPSTSNFIQISDGSSITLAFDDNVAYSDGSPSGADLRVHTYDTLFPAAATIEASGDGVTFVPLIPPPLNDPGRACVNDISQSCNYDDNAVRFIDLDFDSAGLSVVTHVRLTDLHASIDGETSFPLLGFDLDAVEALNSGTVPCASLPSGLVSWWPGDGNANDIADANDGTLQNGAVFAAGKVDQAFSLDGTDDFVGVPDTGPVDLDGFSELTIDAWINFDTSGSGMCAPLPSGGGNVLCGGIVSKYNTQGDFVSYYLAVVADELRLFVAKDRSDYYWETTISADLAAGTWYHVAGTWDGSQFKLYVNGVAQSSTTTPGAGSFPDAMQDSSVAVNIGDFESDAGGNRFGFFDGLIDEVEIFDRALTQAEIQDIFAAGSTGKCKVQAVDIDIKPGSDPNCFNDDGHGVIPVAILGSDTFDVNDINPGTVTLQGLAIRAVGKSNKLLAHYEEVSGDGFTDLVVQIEDTDGTFTSGTGTAMVTGELYDGTLFQGSDAICVVP